MLGRRNEIAHQASFDPRVDIKGFDHLKENFKLPPLTESLRQSVQISEDGQVSGSAPESAEWVPVFGNLLMFGFGAIVNDVPTDLVEDVIFVLQVLVHTISTSTDVNILPLSLRILRCCPNPAINNILSMNARFHLAALLMNPAIDRPHHALPHFRAIEQNNAILEANGRHDDPYEYNTGLFSSISTALTFTNHFSADTKEMLERVLKAATEGPRAADTNFLTIIVRARTNLALVLQQMDVEPEQQKKHTDWVARWLRKNRKMMPDVEQYLRRKDQPPHPIFKALGASWFDRLDLEPTSREEFQSVKKCGTYYCTRECQKEEWQRHKPECTDRKEALLRLRELQSAHAPDAQKVADWLKWRDSPHHGNKMGLVHALGLHRDRSRGWTHIVFRIVQHNPEASRNDLRRRIKITRASVVKLDDDAYRDIDDIMHLDSGESRTYVAGLLDATYKKTWSAGAEMIPIMHLTWGHGIETWLGRSSLDAAALRLVPYDPDWRLSLNGPGGDIALPLSAAAGLRAQDVGQIF
ncbi:hypothetical protein EIP91_007190 [Steccherinum ochraceum]|uniref:MYND-type domain-containing protein n=1 Tax=Steccherinum ochraceum TaxID=92696 RepID=A0A4R0RT67_9APHY|nr:hypothetical protein EIP91_007190 [Steccherinum ochraceum]